MTAVGALVLLLTILVFALAIGIPTAIVVGRIVSFEKIAPYGALQKKDEQGLFDAQTTSKAISAFIDSWREVFGENPIGYKKILSGLRIIWSKDVMNLVVTDSRYRYFAGLALSKKSVKVWTSGYRFVKSERGNVIKNDDGSLKTEPREAKISNTGLGHELIHIVLWNTKGDPDADHEQPKYEGWTEKHTEVEDLWENKLKEINL